MGARQRHRHRLLALPRHRSRARLLVRARMSAVLEGVVDRHQAVRMAMTVAALLAALMDAALVVVVARVGAGDL